MRFFLSLLFLVELSVTLTCYSSDSYNKNYKPLSNQTNICNVGVKCAKVVFTGYKDNNKNKEVGVQYDCSNDFSVRSYFSTLGISDGIESGKCVNTFGMNVCCCSSDKCNSVSGTATIISIIAAIYLMF